MLTLLPLLALLILWQMVEEVYAKALATDPNNPLLHMFVAHHIATYRRNIHIETMHLDYAAVRHTVAMGRAAL